MSLVVADKSEGGDETVGSLLDGRAPMSLEGADNSEGTD